MKFVISLFKKLYLRLNQSEVNLFTQSVMDLLPNYYIFSKDTNSVFTGCNQAFANLMGLSDKKDIIGKQDTNFPWLENNINDYKSDDQEVMRIRQPKLNIEESFSLPNGNKITLLTSKVPLIDKENRVYGLLGIAYNYTSHKEVWDNIKKENFKLEHAYQEARYLQDSLIDLIPNYFIFWKDKQSVYLGCNAAYATHAGLKSADAIINKTDYDLPWSRKESDAYRLDDQCVMKSRLPKLNIVEPQTLADGKKIVLLTSKVPLINNKGDVYGILGIYFDITEQKNAEQKLIDTNKKLEMAIRSKSEFIRNISHDILTPLSGIQQITRMIAEGNVVKEDIPKYAFQASEASTQLMNLFDQIIVVSKEENFDFEDKIVKFDLYHLLEDLKKTYSIVAQHKALQLDIEYKEDIPRYLLGKQQRLHRVLLNLLGNALKFTEEGNVKLLVENPKNTDNTIILRISVIDTGIGIPADKHDAIFEPFSRVQPSYQGQYMGSGLGLHIVKEYIEKMQGEIYLESEPGHGSIFTFIVPFKHPILENDNDEYAPEIVPGNSASIIDTVSKKQNKPLFLSKDQTAVDYQILLVEDDKLMQTIGVALLKNIKGYAVDLAKSGDEALNLANKKQYDAIYMDIGLGTGIDGIETTRLIRANKGPSQHAFITSLTAHADKEISQQCLEVGMQQILFKPLTAEKIQQVHTNLNITTENRTVIDWRLWLSLLS